jgi:hypothetical protein
MTLVECPKCHGNREVPAQGYSLSPESGVMVPDPQVETLYRCDVCDGAGDVMWSCPMCGDPGYVVAGVLRCGNHGCREIREFDPLTGREAGLYDAP